MDGAIFFDHKKAGVGFILRDTKGNILFAASLVEHETLAQKLLSLAILKRIQLYLNQGIQNLVVESDCLLVVEEINKVDLTLLAWSNVVREI